VIAALLFVLLFVGLGLGVVFVALSGGPRGARARADRQPPSRRGGRGVWLVTLVVIVGLGIAVPVAIGISNNRHSAAQAPGGVDLTSAEVQGRSVFAENCSTCHTLGASNAVGRVGPNLDNKIGPLPSVQNKEALILDAIKNGRARGQGQMPAGIVDGQDAKNVAAYIAATAGHG
jgi:mono/diheme cytochrome c family protein